MASSSSQLPSAADLFVKKVPSLDDSQSLLVYAGYLPARPAPNKDDAQLYFLLEKARHLGGSSGKRRRLMLWLNGGPGCSSFDGLMMEIGSWRPSLTAKDNLEWTVPGGAWNEYTDVLFLDQPVGTGFSYGSTGGYAHSLNGAAKDVKYFLKQFLKVFPEYSQDAGCDFYIAGESYAGQYIPYTANELLQGDSSGLALKGIAIGNGAIDPIAQAGSELDMLVDSGVWKQGSSEYNAMKQKNDVCEAAKKKLKAGQHPQEIDGCEELLQEIIELTYTKAAKPNDEPRCINIYDVRLSDTHPACGMTWPPTLSPTYSYLARQDVRQAFHVNTQKHPEAWIECSHRVSAALTDKSSPASVSLLPNILSKGVQVLLFAGDQDLICNWIGVERVVQGLEWGGQKGWGSSPPAKLDWTVNNTKAGWWQSRDNLTFVSVADASHMVGFDKPVQSHDMMLRWMGVDTLIEAAGPSARIPSRLGDEKDRMLIIGGGKSGSSTGDSSQDVIIGADGKTEAQVAEEAKWAAYYNAGSVALIFIVLFVLFGTCVLLRLRRRDRRLGKHQSRGSLGAIALNGSTSQQQQLGRSRGGDGVPSEGHELSHLVSHQEGLDEDEEQDEDDGFEAAKKSRRPNGAQGTAPASATSSAGPNPTARSRTGAHAPLSDGESLFDVGDIDDDDDDDGGRDAEGRTRR